MREAVNYISSEVKNTRVEIEEALCGTVWQH